MERDAAFAIIGLSSAAASLAVQMLWPQFPRPLLWAIFAISMLGFLYGAGCLLIDRYSIRLPRALRLGLVSLREAARRSYEQTTNGALGEMARHDCASEDEILDWYGNAIWVRVQVYGRRSPSRLMEPMPLSQRQSLRVQGGARAVGPVGDRRPTYVDPMVRRRDVRRCIQMFRDHDPPV
jgi:hypothetical protein